MSLTFFLIGKRKDSKAAKTQRIKILFAPLRLCCLCVSLSEKIHTPLLLWLLLTLPLSALPPFEIYQDRIFEGLGKFWDDETRHERFEHLLPLLKQMHEREQTHADDYVQVVTGQEIHFLPYQLILKILYQTQYHSPFDDFEFLRPFGDPTLVTNLDLFFSTFSPSSDLDPDISRQLLSVSLTPETAIPKESALAVFAQNANVSPSKDKILSFLLDAFALEHLWFEGLEEALNTLLSQAPTSTEGMLLQIFIPKEKLDQIVYPSHPYGHPKETDGLHSLQKIRDSDQFSIDDDLQLRLLAGALDPSHIKIFRYTTVPPEEIEAYSAFVQSFLSAILPYELAA